MENKRSLSDDRGNSFGIGFFHGFLRMFGPNRACEFVWVIAFFYAMFDRKARKAAEPYLKHRFPEDTALKRFLHTWTLFVHQGQSLIEAEQMQLSGLDWTFENAEDCHRLERSPGGFVLLTCHFGCWQALISGLDSTGKTVNILSAPDQNRNVDKLNAEKNLKNPVKNVSVNSPMGGLPELAEALNNGEVVCMMGDRCHEDHGLEIEFLGEKAMFPVAAFFLAARTGRPVVPLFAVPGKNHYRITASYGETIHPVMQGRDRNSLVPYVKQFVSELEDRIQKYPFSAYIFENVWKR